jgi:aspartate-semialdehyde dehydrogenase
MTPSPTPEVPASKRGPRVIILGGGGLVGEALVRTLEERAFPLQSLTLLAGPKAMGRTFVFRGHTVGMTALEGFTFAAGDLVFCAASPRFAREWLPRALEAGARVVDASGAWRDDPAVPIVVPGVNESLLDGPDGRCVALAAVPGAFVTPLAAVLAPLHAAAGLLEVDVTGLAAVSGAGRQAVEELATQTARMLNGMDAGAPRVLPRRIAFNCIPEVDALGEGGETDQEAALPVELRRALGLPALAVSAALVRVPVFFGHSWVVRLRLSRSLAPAEALEILGSRPGLVLEAPGADGVPGGYPTAVTEAADTDGVYLGRMRADTTRTGGLAFWLVADNVRACVAVPCVQVAEAMVARRW